jgi:hypothetical protein
MTKTSSSAIAFAALLANLVCVTTGCGGFGAEESPAPHGADPGIPSREDAPEEPTMPPVGGPASASELTDAFGVFVSPAGNAKADGAHDRPLASIQAGIDLGKRLGKRVYVCTGTFHEALAFVDSVSVIGALDCTNNEWRFGAPRTRIESPSSPAARATKITTLTRIEGLEIIAPNATTPSGSSIGLLADHAPALVLAYSKIVAGNAMKGADGIEGTQLTNGPTATGAPFANAQRCYTDTCAMSGGLWVRPPAAAGGTNVCAGAPGYVAQPGGAGGSGGLWEVKQNVSFYFDYYRGDASYGADDGIKNRTSAPGANGSDGANAAAIGTVSPDGYLPANGFNGAAGTTGLGGAGGSGRSLGETLNPNTSPFPGVWRGFGGAGGGAGGCPGLAGTAGAGGGASIAALLVESGMTFDATELVSARGGDAGSGTFGSAPTAGGLAGNNYDPINYAYLSGKPGGRGGAAGMSGNGSSGPSAGIAHLGVKPIVIGTSKITAGTGGAPIAARSRTDAFGTTKTIPATPAGTAKDILSL